MEGIGQMSGMASLLGVNLGGLGGTNGLFQGDNIMELYRSDRMLEETLLSPFDNKKLLVNKKRLSYKAIHLEFNFTENSREHEVIIVAHNMGTVPPNTALLLLKDGKNRQEYFITSTNKINAKILIVYEPPIPD